jgi:hypothetical protein
MERYLRPIILAACLIISTLCFAGDVSYTLWEDESDQVWVRIQNGLDQKIKVEVVQFVFYDAKRKPVDEKQFPCTENCDLAQHDVADFGPFEKPANSESCRLRKVRYRIQ